MSEQSEPGTVQPILAFPLSVTQTETLVMFVFGALWFFLSELDLIVGHLPKPQSPSYSPPPAVEREPIPDRISRPTPEPRITPQAARVAEKNAKQKIIWTNPNAPSDTQSSTPNLNIVFKGTLAAQNLAKTYAVLIKNHPNTVADEDGSLIRIDQKDTVLWKKLTEQEVWPKQSDASQPADLAEALKTTMIGEQGKLTESWIIPNAKVETIFVPTLIRWEEAKSPQNATADEIARFCKKLGLAASSQKQNNETARDSCILQILPKRNTDETRRLPDHAWEVYVRQPAYVLKIKTKVHHAEISLMRKGISAAVTQSGSSRVFFVEDPLNAQINADQASLDADPCTMDGSYLSDWMTVNAKMMNWHLDPFYNAKRVRAVIFDQHYRSAFDFSDENDVNALQLRHPFLNGAVKWDLPCAQLKLKARDLRSWHGAHALAVASVVYGAETLIQRHIDDGLKVHGLIHPGDLRIAPIRDMVLDAQGGSFPRRTMIASLQTGPPGDNGAIAFNASSLAKSRAVLIASAPTRSDGQNDYPPFEPETFDKGLHNCTEWPSCLGATPFVMVVAAVDRSGKLMENSPDGAPYRLGGRNVWLGAPGEDVLTAALTPSAPILTVQTGSSLAAPAVAAVAMSLQSDSYDNDDALRIIARVAATTDLFKDADRVRFGALNARRALTGGQAAETDDVIWEVGEDKESSPIYGKIEGLNWRPGRCADEDAPLGFLPYYREDVHYYGTSYSRRAVDCIPVHKLLRIVHTEDLNGNPLFTIIYYAPGSKPFYHELYPSILRRRLMKPEDGRAFCRFDGTETEETRACLYVRYKGRSNFEPLSLIQKDIVFAIGKIDETERSLNIDAPKPPRQ